MKPQSSKGKGPRILLLDIETLPNVVTSWSLRVDGYLDHKNIVQERTILCAAWKWLGDPRIYVAKINPSRASGQAEDYRILKRLSREIEKADAVVAHNGDSFDMKWIRARALLVGLPPIKPVVQIDTKKIAKDNFYFNSNRLDYIAKALKIGEKIKTDYDLWLRCMPGQPLAERRKAIAEMVFYNKYDVTLLEKVYLRLRPCVPARINNALFQGDFTSEKALRTCPTCGEQSLVKRGNHYTRANVQLRLQCTQKGCGAWSYRTTKRIPR